MSRPIKNGKTLARIAKESGRSIATIKRESAKNLPMGEGDRLAILPDGVKPNPEDFSNLSDHEAKRRRTVVAWLREQHNLKVSIGEYEPKNKVREDGIRIGATLDAGLSSLVNDLPGMMAGLSEKEIREKLVPRLELLKNSIKKELSRATA